LVGIISPKLRDDRNNQFVKIPGIKSVDDSVSGFVKARHEVPDWLVLSANYCTTQRSELTECQPSRSELLGFIGNLCDDVTQTLFDKKMSVQDEQYQVIGLLEMLIDLFNRALIVHYRNPPRYYYLEGSSDQAKVPKNSHQKLPVPAMRFASTRPQFNQFASRQTPETLLYELAEWDLLQCGPSLDCPLVPLRINVFGIDISFGMN
jgi:hypothetical protein